LHHALISIPRKLAYILHERPASIAPAVEAFYLRDPIALKALQNSSNLAFPPKDLVAVSTRFTKVLYAQLKSQQQFSNPEAWKDILAQTAKEIRSDSTADKNYAQFEMGMKVTSGFEMLVSDSKNDDNRVVREIKLLLDDIATDGDGSLPSDRQISEWKDISREDDEKWLDINFEDFEKELSGKGGEKKAAGIPGAFGPEPPSGFGDAKTQADLKKMVERFEAFLNDEDAGLEGAEMDDMDIDDDDEDLDDDSEDEDKDVSFDENVFARMMREMMGMPSAEADLPTKVSENASKKNVGKNRIEELDSDEEEDEDEAEEIRKVMQRMEAELGEGGALDLDQTPKKLSALKDKGQSGKDKDTKAGQKWEDESDDEEVNIDFNLAKNLLESFKSQAGMAGPGGNLLGMMGIQLPRDEVEETTAGKKSQSHKEN
jgi:hypothetical protein